MAEERSIRIQNRRIHNRLLYRRRPQKHLFVRRHLRPREECLALRQEMIEPRLSRLLFRFLLWIFSSFTDHLFFKCVRLEICNIQSHNYLFTKTLSLWSVRCYNLNSFFTFVPLSSADKISHLLPADSLVLFDLMLLLLCCSTRTNHSLGDLFDVDIFKSFTFWSLGPVQVSLLRCIFLCV